MKKIFIIFLLSIGLLKNAFALDSNKPVWEQVDTLICEPIIQTEYWQGTKQHQKLDLILESLCQTAYEMKALSDKNFQELKISDLNYFNGDILLIPKNIRKLESIL